MAVVRAKGDTKDGEYKDIKITITGEKYVENIECNDWLFGLLVEVWIEDAKGAILNAYSPPANTMLQASATLYHFFDYTQIEHEGEFEKIPYDPDPNIIY